MRTTLNIDENPLGMVMTFTGEKNKSRAIRKTLEAYMNQRAVSRLLDHAGQIDIEGNWRKLRAGHSREE